MIVNTTMFGFMIAIALFSAIGWIVTMIENYQMKHCIHNYQYFRVCRMCRYREKAEDNPIEVTK